MIVNLRTTETVVKEVDIEFPFYEEILQSGSDSELPYREHVKITEKDYTKIIVKESEITIIHYESSFTQLYSEAYTDLDFQPECKEAFENALQLAKENILKL